MRQTVAVALLAAAAAFTDSSILWADPPDAAGQSQAHAASDRRRVFVGVVGFAALVFGLAGLWMVRRSRRAPERGEQSAPPPTVVVKRTAAEPPRPPSAAGSMICPTCRGEYGAESRFCKLDGNRLVAAREGADARGPSGGVCPVCEQGYDPGIASCPVHDEELVPAGIRHAEERPSGQYPKICPTCGVQYPNGSGFCGADGSALVTVN